MLQRLKIDPLWAREDEDFVQQVSFADTDGRIPFAAALDACSRLVGMTATQARD
jgi:hypothetical protein